MPKSIPCVLQGSTWRPATKTELLQSMLAFHRDRIAAGSEQAEFHRGQISSIIAKLNAAMAYDAAVRRQEREGLPRFPPHRKRPATVKPEGLPVLIHHVRRPKSL